VLSVLVCELASALLPVIDGWFLTQGKVKFNLGRVVDLYISFVGPAMMIMGGLVASRNRSEELRKASEFEAQIAKNRLLQGQIHPHVLFNALNGLAELIHKDPKAAELAVCHLSDLLRRILKATEHMRMPLGEERKIITDYLALESIRLGARLTVRWEWDERLDSIEVPPLLVQPMVENAIKHGIAPSIQGGEVVLRAQSRERAVFLEVWNSGEPFLGNEDGKGIGVNNLRSRLALHFRDKAQFSVGSSGQGTLASIRIEATQVEWPNETIEGPGR
jgi:LytS/YehU family sensor histidine kinase